MSTSGRFLRGLVLMGALGLTLGVSGCASTMSTRVTSFQQWPADAQGQTYQFVQSQSANLEQRAYQDMLRASIGVTGLVEAPQGAPARFEVAFDYGVTQVQVMTRQPYDPYFYGGYGRYYGNPYGRFWGPGYGWGGFWGPEWVDVPVTGYRNTVNIRINDRRQNGAEVYRSTASTLSDRPEMVRVMPYLVRSIFDNFPGNNGSERDVEYKVN